MSSDKISRRQFLETVATTAAVAYLGSPAISLALDKLQPIPEIKNPLEHYPPREWEKVYRDVYTPDSSYIFACTPNDTHNCYLRAYVKNGVVTRIGPSQRYRDATDIYATKASARWDPRICNKGVAIVGRFTGIGGLSIPRLERVSRSGLRKVSPGTKRVNLLRNISREGKTNG